MNFLNFSSHLSQMVASMNNLFLSDRTVTFCAYRIRFRVWVKVRISFASKLVLRVFRIHSYGISFWWAEIVFPHILHLCKTL